MVGTDGNMNSADYSYVFRRFQLKVAGGKATELLIEGHAIQLSTNELTILRELLDHRGEFVTTKVLLALILGKAEGAENNVHQAINALRKVLNDTDLIKTERYKGYCFTGEVMVLEGSDPAPNPSPPATPSPGPTPDPPSAPARTRPRDPFVAIAILVSAPIFILPFALALAGLDLDRIGKQIGIIQALVILVGLGFDVYFSPDRVSPDEAEDDTKRARLAVQQLRRSWRWLLACWCALYFAVPFSHLLAQASSGRELALPVITTLLNNASALMLVLCYWVLKRPTVISVAGRELENVPWRAGLLVVGGFSLIEALGIVAFEYLRADEVKNVIFGADLLSGVIGGIAMALCISRLDSRLLGTKGWLPIVPIILYLYAVIQPFYPLINQTVPAPASTPAVTKFALTQLAFIQLAFLLKSIMFIYVTELFRSGRFLFYMIRARRFYENVEAEWNDFRSTRAS
jgi:DNA-binding winged helix-turn-helix (wHTH) protein